VKVSARLTGDGVTRADEALSAVRRRAIARLEALIVAREEARRLRRSLRARVSVSAADSPER